MENYKVACPEQIQLELNSKLSKIAVLPKGLDCTNYTRYCTFRHQMLWQGFSLA